MGPFCTLFFNSNQRSNADFTVGNSFFCSIFQLITDKILHQDPILPFCNVGPCFQNCICQLNSGETFSPFAFRSGIRQKQHAHKVDFKGLFIEPFMFPRPFFPFFTRCTFSFRRSPFSDHVQVFGSFNTSFWTDIFCSFFCCHFYRVWVCSTQLYFGSVKHLNHGRPI